MTAPASPGQPGDKPTPSAPRQPPWWRPWLIPLGLLLSAWLLLPLVFRDAPQLTYTEFLQRVDQGEVDSVAIEANGDAHGRLDDGSSFTTAIPVDLAGDGLIERLEEAEVTIEAVPDRTTPHVSLVRPCRPVCVRHRRSGHGNHTFATDPAPWSHRRPVASVAAPRVAGRGPIASERPTPLGRIVLPAT